MVDDTIAADTMGFFYDNTYLLLIYLVYIYIYIYISSTSPPKVPAFLRGSGTKLNPLGFVIVRCRNGSI